MKVFFLVLVYVFNFDLFEFSAAILEKGLLVLFVTTACFIFLLKLKWPKSKNISFSIHFVNDLILTDQSNLTKKSNACFNFLLSLTSHSEKNCSQVFSAGINWSRVQNTISEGKKK